MCVSGWNDGLSLLSEVRGSWLVKQYLTIQKEMDLTESRGASLGQTKHELEGGTEYLLCEKRKETSLSATGQSLATIVCLFVRAETDSEVLL